MRRRVILWGQYLGHIVDQHGSRFLVEWQHVSESQSQSTWVDVSEIMTF